jgi:hypothetical protein
MNRVACFVGLEYHQHSVQAPPLDRTRNFMEKPRGARSQPVKIRLFSHLLTCSPAAPSLWSLWIALLGLAMHTVRMPDIEKTWTVSKAAQWYAAQPWPCGFNYVPAHAISYTEMWMADNFDPKLIDAELALAQDLGFNCLRVVLPFVVWEHEPAAFRGRFDAFLDTCHRRGLKVMPALFDDCVFGPITDPVCGPQPAVVPGWYANGWTPSPGHALVRDPAAWPRLEQYVQDLLGAWRTDPRLWVWDLYNEPTNGGLGDVSLPLVEKVFQWARAVAPVQPVTVALWNGNEKLNDLALRQSDILTFHNYNPPDDLAQMIDRLRRHGRPLLCTEWLARHQGSTVAACLPIFRAQNVGCLHWGLVNGKTQTHLNWGHRPGQPDPALWQHDLFRRDHTPYAPAELALFQNAARPSA